MTDLNYSGLGSSQEEARKELTNVAKKNGLNLEPTKVEYQCVLQIEEKRYEGNPNSDYGMAFASVLEEAGLSTSEIKSEDLEVVARGTYATQTKAKPRPSGSIKEKSSRTITDLF